METVLFAITWYWVLIALLGASLSVICFNHGFKAATFWALWPCVILGACLFVFLETVFFRENIKSRFLAAWDIVRDDLF